MWYHGQDVDWHKEAEGVMDIGTGRCGGLALDEGVSISPFVVCFHFIETQEFDQRANTGGVCALFGYSLPMEFVI